VNYKTKRVGCSFDLHRLVPDRPLILGGIPIPYHKGLLGHSDGDVVLHVITECILGALNLGDLGTNFGTNRPEYLNIDSIFFLNQALAKLREENCCIINIDLELLCEEPKLSIYYNLIRDRLSDILGVNKTYVSIKSTTLEKVGIIGNTDAIGCFGVILIGGL
jgi:2-C-methyl-D-erythritol 2,4-cyclodiphosphate synthase